jgi:hypothetical protein
MVGLMMVPLDAQLGKKPGERKSGSGERKGA